MLNIFSWPIGHLCIFLGKMSLPFLCLFFKFGLFGFFFFLLLSSMSSLHSLTVNLLSLHSLQIFSPTPDISFHFVATDFVALIFMFLILSVVCPAQPTH